MDVTTYNRTYNRTYDRTIPSSVNEEILLDQRMDCGPSGCLLNHRSDKQTRTMRPQCRQTRTSRPLKYIIADKAYLFVHVDYPLDSNLSD